MKLLGVVRRRASGTATKHILEMELYKVQCPAKNCSKLCYGELNGRS